MKNTIRQKENAELWEARFERAVDRSGSLKDFCKAEGVTLSLYCYWKNKLSRKAAALTRPETAVMKNSSSGFDRVQVLEPPSSRSQTLSAKWVAELILHLHKGIAR